MKVFRLVFHSHGARLLFCFGTLALLLLLPLLASAQTNGLISGTVTDKSGAAVVGAQVVIASVGGNLTRTTETNGEGVYVASSLPSGTYNITVIAKGFQKFEAQNFVLEVAQKARVDVMLTVGTVTEEVVVTGENVAQVETQSSDIGQTITNKQVQELELNGRNFTQLVTLAPGVINQTGQDEGKVGVAGNILYSINGGRTEYNNWEIDGGDNMDNGSNATLNVYPNLEAIAEFKVLTSNYGAQFGKNGSGTIEVETKSGTSQFHGSAFYYGRNDFFNANSWADNASGIPRPAYKRHDWGYTVGGPIYKKKTFFFWSQEWRREIDPGTPIIQNVPSDAERGGNFNDVCPTFGGNAFDPTAFPDCPYLPGSLVTTTTGTATTYSATPFVSNTITPLSSTTATALLSLIPHANGVSGQYAVGQDAGQPLPAYLANPSFPTRWREELIRVDHNLTDNHRLTFRWIHDTWSTVNQGPLWGGASSFDNTNTTFTGPTTSFVTRLTSNFSPTLLNEFVASYTDDHIFLSNQTNVVDLPSGGIDLSPLYQNGLEGKIPAFSLASATSSVAYGGGFSVDEGYFPWKNANPTYSYRDIVTKIVRNHTLFFGGYFVAAQKNQESSVDLQGSLSFTNGWTATTPGGATFGSTNNPFADLLLGEINSYSQNENKIYFYDRYKIFEPFFQDDWRITRKLTLNLGLRWSLFGRYQEKHDQEFGFSEAAYNANLAKVPSLFPFGSANSGLLDLTSSTSQYTGQIQCGNSNPTVAGVSPGVTGCLKNKWMNPGPRFGFAYDPFGDGKWAIRGGYGIFFEHMNGNEANAELLEESPTPFALNAVSNPALGYANLTPAAAGLPGPPSLIYSIPDQVQWPYMQQWNLGVEHQLPSNIMLSVAYVGSKGTHLTRQFDANQLAPVPAADNPYLSSANPNAGATIDPGGADCANFGNFNSQGLPTTATLGNGTPVPAQAIGNLYIACKTPNVSFYYRPYQAYGTIERVENTANSIYNSLQVALRRSLGDLTLSASYTYSHMIDSSSDRGDPAFYSPYDPGLSRASSNYDIRHAFSLSYVYALPFFKKAGALHTALGGWQISGIATAQTGLPFTVTNASTYSDNAGVAQGIGGVSSYPNVVGDISAVTSAEKAAYAAGGKPGVLAYNPAAFALPVGLTFGDAARNEFRMPGRFNNDFGLFKRFAFRERYAFEFRWENFNVFNHTQFNAISGSTNTQAVGANVGMGCAGTTATGLDPTCATSGFLLLDGTHLPRIMQFGLRFQF